VEKFNGTLTAMLAAYATANHTDWDELLPMALFSYRMSVQKSTKRVPAELLYARELCMPIDLDVRAPKLSFTKLIKADIRRGQENVAKVAVEGGVRHEKSCNSAVFKVGDWVRVHDEVTSSGLTRKFGNIRYRNQRIAWIYIMHIGSEILHAYIIYHWWGERNTLSIRGQGFNPGAGQKFTSSVEIRATNISAQQDVKLERLSWDNVKCL